MVRRKVHGVGINDADYKVSWYTTDKKRDMCPFYKKWIDMLKRCYLKSFQVKNKCYIGTTVCEEWLTFSNFKNWMESQDWEGNVLDKDILGTGKLYSPETCVFVPSFVNNCFVDRCGVCYHTRDKKYTARIGVGLERFQIGYFDSEVEAKNAYEKHKNKYLKDILEKYLCGDYDLRVVKRMRERIIND